MTTSHGPGTPRTPTSQQTAERRSDLITVYDERGREVQITRPDWIESCLRPAIQQAWDDSKALAGHIVQALRDDMADEVVDAARRLMELDQSEDCLVIAAVTRLETDDLDGAEQALQRSLAKHGPTGLVLTNLAKVLYRRGDTDTARATLRRGLDLNPNEDNALLWWAALQRDERGEAGYLGALEELAALPGAWRPQLWLARERLRNGDKSGARSLYQHALSHAANSPDALMMITGDLGNAGALQDMVELGLPRYEPGVHGPHAGMNLARALAQLGRIDEARALVHRLQAMGWSPFAAALAQLEGEIVAAVSPERDDGVPQITLLSFDAPLWTRGLFEPDWLLPPRGEDAPIVLLVSFSNEIVKAQAPQVQMTDETGRLTRALPLYLAEALRLRFHVRTRCSMLASQDRGPVVVGQRTDPRTLEHWLPSAGARRVIVTGTLVPDGVELQLWESGAGQPPETIHVDGPLSDIGGLTARTEAAVVSALTGRGLLAPAGVPALYKVPGPDLLAGYVTALEQLFFQLLTANHIVKPETLWNERGFFETYFGLTDAWADPPDSALLLAVCGVLAAVQYGSALVQPYRKLVVEWLDHAPAGSPLERLAPAVLKRLGEQDRLQQALQRAPAQADAGYAEWLERVKAAG